MRCNIIWTSPHALRHPCFCRVLRDWYCDCGHQHTVHCLSQTNREVATARRQLDARVSLHFLHLHLLLLEFISVRVMRVCGDTLPNCSYGAGSHADVLALCLASMCAFPVTWLWSTKCASSSSPKPPDTHLLLAFDASGSYPNI